MDLTVLETFLSEGIQKILGSSDAVAIFAVLTFVVYAVFAGLDMTLALVILIPLLIALVAAGILQGWIVGVLAIGLALILYISIRNSMER